MNGRTVETATGGRPPSTAGFTLIELMIVVVIIGVIAAIAYPSYQRSVRESNRSEAHAALTTLAALQERFFANQNSYGQIGTTCTTVNAATTTEHGWYTTTVALFTDVPGGTATTPADGNADCAIDSGHAAAYTLTATAAAAPQTKDSGCTTMTLTSAGAKGPPECWR